jgi:glycosyltransferase involved in cell wall biosynthesis
MKILYLCQHFSTPAGSIGQRPFEMARRLLLSGHQVTLICGSYAGANTGLEHLPFKKGMRRGNVCDIDLIEFDLKYSNHDNFLTRSLTFLKFVLRSTKYALRMSYDLVFATSTPLTIAIPAILARWLRRKPFVFEVRDLWPELPKAMGVITNPCILYGLGILEYLGYHSANYVIGLSPGMVAGIAKRGIPSDRIKLISNGCDLALFEDVSPSMRPEGVNEKDLMVIYTGTHGLANGLDAILDAALELKKRGINHIKLILIGQGKLKAQLQSRAAQEALDSIIFLAPLPKKQLANLMASADLGLQILADIPEFYNGTSPNKFFDYIAAGLPVLNNYPGWLAEKITEYNCGFVVPPKNPAAFVDALERASSEPLVLKEMGQRAKQLAKQEFDRNLLSKQWVEVLEAAM